MKLLIPLILSLGVACRCAAFDFDAPNDIAAVSARASGYYVRPRLPSGAFVPEYYAFGEGGAWKGVKPDATIDPLNFLDVAHALAAPLERQNYLPSRDPGATGLLVMVYWGTTHSPEESGLGIQLVEWAQIGRLDLAFAGDQLVEKADKLNAMMLGYDSWWSATQGDRRGTSVGRDREDLRGEIEENRYFVVLMAYDFQLLWKQRKHKLLWETRFSIRQRHHDFDRDLPSIARYASRYFGQDTHGLIHDQVPLGRVDIGDMKSLGTVPGK